jgi:hypothetical protein
MDTLGTIALWVIGVIAGIWLLVSLFSWSLFDPWNDPFWYSFNRQATNLTYLHASGAPTGRVVVAGTAKVSPADYVSPTCPFEGHDIFNPTGSTSSQLSSGTEITFLTGGARQSVTVPNGMVHRVTYAGKVPRAKFSWVKVVFFYDHNWDSLWLDSRANGPKDHVINCMRTLSLGQRMLVGLQRVTLFEPAHPGNVSVRTG